MKKCFVCAHDRLDRGYTNKMLESNGNIIIIKEIHCIVCSNCGEIYFETDVMVKLENILKMNVSELEVVNFQKVE